MIYRLDQAAFKELSAAVKYLDGERSGTGRRLLDRVESTLQRLLAFPESSPVILERRGIVLRRAVVTRFRSYQIIYLVSENVIEVISIAHGKREPGYWLDRLPS